VSHRLIHVALLTIALHAAGARAQEAKTPLFSFNGFGTLGVVHSSEDKADFTSSIFKPNGAGYSHAWSADVDSLIGGQVTANFTPKLSAVLQVIAEQNYDNSYRPHVEWANFKYEVTPDFSVRAGRIVLPTFLYADTRKVGYAYPWVRPPPEVYGLVPINTSNGVDATYRTRVGDVVHTLQANYGGDERSFPGGGTLKAERSWGVGYMAEYHAVTALVTYHASNATLDTLKPIFDGFRQFGAQGVALADKYGVDNKRFEAIAIGASYDPGKWFLIGEWTRATTHSVLGQETGWYVSGGYRLGKFTPYLTYGQVTVDNLSDPGLNLSTLPPFLAGPAAGLNAALNSILSAKPARNTLSIGGRWELTRNAALKLQYDHTRIGAGSSGGLSNLQPGFQPSGKVNVLSATMDFVF